jgi:hypothetical protein
MTVTALKSFMDEIEAFCKRPKHGYSSCKQDILNEFGDLSDIDSFFDKPQLINLNGLLRINKTRLANSGQGIGKSGGFRIIYIVNKAVEEVTFLHIFAKKGSQGKDNISIKELKILMAKYIAAKKSNSLISITQQQDLLKVLR